MHVHCEYISLCKNMCMCMWTPEFNLSSLTGTWGSLLRLRLDGWYAPGIACHHGYRHTLTYLFFFPLGFWEFELCSLCLHSKGQAQSFGFLFHCRRVKLLSGPRKGIMIWTVPPRPAFSGLGKHFKKYAQSSLRLDNCLWFLAGDRTHWRLSLGSCTY